MRKAGLNLILGLTLGGLILLPGVAPAQDGSTGECIAACAQSLGACKREAADDLRDDLAVCREGPRLGRLACVRTALGEFRTAKADCRDAFLLCIDGCFDQVD